MRALLLLCALVIHTPIWATENFRQQGVVDVHGVDDNTAASIKQRYADHVRDLEGRLMTEYLKTNPETKNNSPLLAQLLDEKEDLIKKIQHYDAFAYVDLQTVTYPNRLPIYTTIEIVQNDQPNRLRFLNLPPSIMTPHKQPSAQYALSTPDSTNDLIKQMIQYQNKVSQLLDSKQIDFHDHSCPVYHCTLPFTNPILKPYLHVFNQGFLREKKALLNLLNNDPDPVRRAAAVFLVGHDPDPNEIVRVLLPHTYDSSHLVRNNALRVIGETIKKAHICDLDIIPFIDFLDSPYLTDRNKALYILYVLADSPIHKQKIKQKGKGPLLTLLKLQQPNNHEFAYLILQKITGQSFADTDIARWEKWLTSNP